MWFETIAKSISEKTGINISKIKLTDSFSDVGFDSVDTIELIMDFEDDLGIDIDELDVETISDLVGIIEKKTALA